MKRILGNPYLAFPLGVALAMALAVAWSLTQSDRVVINQVFLGFLFLLPLLAAVFAFLVRQAWLRRITTWLATTALGLISAYVVFLASGVVFPYKSVPVYNYPHFHYSSYAMGGARRVNSGELARDGTLYTLKGDPVRLSDLWKERPIVIEFGSVT